MILISHRGNIDKKNPNLENNPEYIEKALYLGYNVEIDVWYENEFWLGHDTPQYKIDVNYLMNTKLWCHAKNGKALSEMSKYKNIHYFWHQDDDFTLTSKKFIWTYPKKILYYNSICVLPELGYIGSLKNCNGVCSDYIKQYRELK
jgi:hypothetical protein